MKNTGPLKTLGEKDGETTDMPTFSTKKEDKEFVESTKMLLTLTDPD